MMEGIANFFSPEAGQRRTRWLNGVGDQIGEAARYYLGPTGIPERAGAAASVAGMFSPGADVMDAATASGDLMRARSPMEAATAGAGMVGALGSMFIPGNAQRAGEALTRFGADESGALPVDIGRIINAKASDTSLSYRIADDGTAEIYSVKTPQAKRGQGSARAAMSELLADLDAAGVNETRLIASPLDRKTGLSGLVRFYESLGFVPTGQSANALGEPWMARTVRPK